METLNSTGNINNVGPFEEAIYSPEENLKSIEFGGVVMPFEGPLQRHQRLQREITQKICDDIEENGGHLEPRNQKVQSAVESVCKRDKTGEHMVSKPSFASTQRWKNKPPKISLGSRVRSACISVLNLFSSIFGNDSRAISQGAIFAAVNNRSDSYTIPATADQIEHLQGGGEEPLKVWDSEREIIVVSSSNEKSSKLVSAITDFIGEGGVLTSYRLQQLLEQYLSEKEVKDSLHSMGIAPITSKNCHNVLVPEEVLQQLKVLYGNNNVKDLKTEKSSSVEVSLSKDKPESAQATVTTESTETVEPTATPTSVVENVAVEEEAEETSGSDISEIQVPVVNESLGNSQIIRMIEENGGRSTSIIPIKEYESLVGPFQSMSLNEFYNLDINLYGLIQISEEGDPESGGKQRPVVEIQMPIGTSPYSISIYNTDITYQGARFVRMDDGTLVVRFRAILHRDNARSGFTTGIMYGGEWTVYNTWGSTQPDGAEISSQTVNKQTPYFQREGNFRKF